MTFEEDLTKRRIDVAAFATGDPEKFAAWQLLYQQVHPNTFYTAVKMVINDVRRRFWLAEAPKLVAAPAAAVGKPAVRRATAMVPSTASALPDEPSPSVDRTPEPAPRSQAVIRRPPVISTAVPEEQELVAEKPLSPEKEVGSTPETSKPGGGRPVFRRPSSEANVNDTAAENQTTSENKEATASEKEDALPEISKPSRPRPVIRKPVTPATNSTEAQANKEASAEASAIPLPEHSNPNPAEIPKSPRPRPVFKRPAPVSSTETEKITAPLETPATPLKVENNSPTAPDVPATEAPKTPRPRPVIKRPAEPASKLTVNPGQELVNPIISVQEQIVNRTETIVESASTPEIPVDPPTLKPPRPRPVFKRPAKPELPGGTVDNELKKE